MDMTNTRRRNKTKTDTSSLYMDAAEELFIHNGYEGTSIGGIAERSGAHKGTLHHYWGNKEALFRAVCERRFGPIQAVQMERLQACAQGLADCRAVTLTEILRALIEPPMLAAAEDEARRQTTRMLYGRALTEPSAVVTTIMADIFREASQLFVDLLRAQCPQFSASAFYWRLNCALGAFIFSQSFGDRLEPFFDEKSQPVDWSFVVDQIVDFIALGLGSAPATAATPAKSRRRKSP